MGFLLRVGSFAFAGKATALVDTVMAGMAVAVQLLAVNRCNGTRGVVKWDHQTPSPLETLLLLLVCVGYHGNVWMAPQGMD